MALVPGQVLRVAILLSYFSILCNYKAIDMPAHQTYGGSWKFLTFINLVSHLAPATASSSSGCEGCDPMSRARKLAALPG
ncbi:putative Androgen-induced 1 protein [Naja naja]|nr:putative Androgen-induced 1 protein [Naja naja]